MDGPGVREFVLLWGVFEWGEIIVEEVVGTASLCKFVHGMIQAALYASDNLVLRRAMNGIIQKVGGRLVV